MEQHADIKRDKFKTINTLFGKYVWKSSPKPLEKHEGAETKTLSTLFLIIVVGYGVLYALSMIDFSFLKGEVIAYGLVCEVKPQYNYCPGKTNFAMPPEHFKPNKDRQEVLSWTKGSPPERFTNCAVLDRTNWKCEDDNSATFGFQNGEYFVYGEDTFEEYWGSRQAWLHQDCIDSNINELLCIPFHGILRGE